MEILFISNKVVISMCIHTYSWLSYSESVNGGLHIPCIFHLKINHNKVGKCVTSSLIKFKYTITEI